MTAEKNWKEDNREILKRCTGLVCDTPENTKRAAERALFTYDGSTVFGGLSIKALHDAARAVLGELNAPVRDAATQLAELAQEAAENVSKDAAESVRRNIADIVKDIVKSAGDERTRFIEEARDVYETLTEKQRASVQSAIKKAGVADLFDFVAGGR